MNEEESLDLIPLPDTDMVPQRPSAYERLMRQSKKMGGVATKAFHDVRDALYRERSLPAPPNFFAKWPQQGLAKSRHQRELEQARKLQKTVKKAHEVLASVETVFPVTIFPDRIVVDRTKITIKKRSFFFLSDTISFQVQDVLNVSCGTGPFFGSLTIASRVMSSIDHFRIDHLWRSDAIFLKNLIQGHIIATNNKLETDQLSVEEMITTLCELGIDSDG